MARNNNSDNVAIEISKSEAIVLHAFLAEFNKRKDYKFEHVAEAKVLTNIEKILADLLIEPHEPDYEECLQKAREYITMALSARRI